MQNRFLNHLLVLLLMTLGFFSNPSVRAQSVASVPMYSPIYQDLRYMKTRGFFSDLDLTSLPLNRSEIASALYSLKKDTSLAGINEPVLHNLYAEFEPDIDALKSEPSSLSNLLQRGIEKLTGKQISQKTETHSAKLGLTLDDYLQGPDPTVFRGGIRTQARLDLFHHLSIVNSMFISNNPDVARKGSSKVWRGLSGYTELAYLRSYFQYKHLKFDILLGRDFLRFGPGRTGTLLISDASRPFDQYRLSARYKFAKFIFGTLQLNNHGNVVRYLSFHRLSIFAAKNLTINLTESILYTGSQGSPAFKFLNPFLLYHAEQLNSTGNSAGKGNTIESIDIDWYPERNFHLWGSFLLDDFQIDKKTKGDLEPNELGFLTGAGVTNLIIPRNELWVEYAAITNRTYQTPHPDDHYVQRGYPVGYFLGNDFDNLTLFYGQWLQDFPLQPYFKLSYYRNGANGLNTPFDTPWTADSITVESGYGEPFPTTPVEYITTVQIGFRYQPSYTLGITPEVEYQQSTLRGNQETNWQFRLNLWWDPRWRL